MKKIFLLTAVLVAALAINAWAVGEGNDNTNGDDSNAPISSSVTATVDTPGVFEATYALQAPTFLLTGNDVIANSPTTDYYAGTAGGSVTYSTNLNNTRFKVSRSAWTYSGNPPGYGGDDEVGGDFQLKLLVSLNAGNGSNSGVVNAPFNSGNGGTIQISPNTDDIVTISNGDAARTASFSYAVYGVDITDDPGTYTSSVTYTMYDAT
jgi:hypothetical protein